LPKDGVHFLDARGPDEMAVYAIGDLHGRLDLLSLMYDAIAADLKEREPRDWRIIHLGDYVDRGPDSKSVIDFLIEARREERIILLAGNHDIGFLDFLDSGDASGLFARFGGDQTAQSYGVHLDFADAGAFRKGHAQLVEALPVAHGDFLRSLGYSVSFGDFFFCHAGIRPGVPLDRQDPHDLVWIRQEFLGYPGLHPKVIVHGHTPAPAPEVLANRVNVDTGAFSTGRLTALIIAGADKEILTVREEA
jgi:serine/threonine protein phosphatase 1